LIKTNNILNFIQGTLSEQEKSRIELWIDSSDENRKEYMFLKSIFDESQNLEDIKLFNDEDEWNEIEGLLEEKKTKLISFSRRTMRIASIAASFLLLYLTINYFFNKEPLYKEIATTNFLDTINLVDGSIVYLGENSKLKYYTRIDDKSIKRYVELNGKAKFEVSKYERLPFVVQTGGAGIDVLGTIFNTNEVDSGVGVENIEGLIKLFEWNNAANSIILKKGEKAVFQNGGITKILPKVEKKVMIGRYQRIEDVVDYLFRKYDSKVNTAPYAHINMEDKIFINLKQPLEKIMSQLDTTADFKFRKTCSNCYEIKVLRAK
jgi:ferric-dicitrate binding protein FerR (iron transport regulator)